MNLLVLTQKVDRDDDVLGFFHVWLAALAERAGALTVLALSVGRHDLPRNVEVVSLGKERGAGRWRRAAAVLRESVRRRGSYDAVLVHMNPEYVVLAGGLWRLLGKRVGLWYTHREVTWKLRVAEKLVHVAMTAAEESFRLPSGKLRVLGHGIDVEAFRCPPRRPAGLLRIVSVGRLTPIKRCEILIEAASLLAARSPRRFSVSFVGRPAVPSDAAYAEKLEDLVRARGLGGTVSFRGSVPYPDMPSVYCGADISVNLAPTGGIDKAVLESMAAGAIPIVANRAFAPYFGARAGRLLLAGDDPEDLARAIGEIMELPLEEREAVGRELAETARERAGLDRLVNRMLAFLAAP